MGYVLVFLIIGALICLFCYLQWPGSPRRTGRAGGSSAGTEFEVIDWNGRPEPMPPPLGRKRVSRDFAGAVRHKNPDALCLLTGRRAADCTCDIHRSLT
jgi:hypothetical protein